jgi:UDP-N-acetylglucosamine 1-carboxyvinyltransferase
LNNRVREVREARGLTQAQLAQRLGNSESAVAGLESPTRSLRLPTLRRVAAALECSVSDLLPA